MAGPAAPLTQELVAAAAIACLALMALAACHLCDPHKEARRYYSHHSAPALFPLMQLCIFILLVALVFNARYLAWHTVGWARRRFT